MLSLSFPPSVNHCYTRNVHTGQRVLTREGEEWIYRARWEIKAAKIPQYTDTWLYVDLYFYMPDKRKRDSHNYLKLLLDAMEGVIINNDYWLMPRIQLVEIDREHPRIEVKLEPAGSFSLKGEKRGAKG